MCFTGLLLVGGCSEGDGQPPMGQLPQGGPAAAGPPTPGIKQIMVKLAKGPQSLTPIIGNELNQDPPPWETIQGQTKEYVASASELGKYDPPKGAKESWIKLTAAFADSAVELDRAASAKDKDAARVAHDQLKNSCNACHQPHRGMGRAGGGRPPGGPPPGGPGGPPPGGPPPDAPG
jgi:hypothetical protein